MKAIWNGEVIADSDNTVVVENCHYFPPISVHHQYLEESSTHTTCNWKGIASYYTISVDGKQNEDAAWYYPEPTEKAMNIKNYIAFWRGVDLVE